MAEVDDAQSLHQFKQQKLTCLTKVDLSRKGNIDKAIVDLVDFINKQNCYFTTSSCSGRTYVFEEESELQKRKKKGCRWLYTTHDVCDSVQVMKALTESKGNAFLKFEPFVLHVQCSSMENAQNMIGVAVATGFKNSGITVGKKGKIIAATRSTLSLEIPLTHNGTLLVSAEYVEYITDIANCKMKDNFDRLNKFYEELKKKAEESSEQQLSSSHKDSKSKKKNEKKENKNEEEEVDFALTFINEDFNNVATTEKLVTTRTLQENHATYDSF